MKLIYQAQIHIPCHNSSVIATQDFFKAICRDFKIPKKTVTHLELAIEEALVGLFKNTADKELKDQAKVSLEIFNYSIKISVKVSGRPFDFDKVPKYQPRTIPDKIDKIDALSFGIFLLESVVDSVQWRYVEKEGQEVILIKELPEILEPEEKPDFLKSESLPDKFTANLENLSYRWLRTYQEALALASATYDLYGYSYRDILYYPQEVLEKNKSGLIYSCIAIDNETGVVYGHSALVKQKEDDRVAEVGRSFVRPECRKSGVFNQIAAKIAEQALNLGLEGVFATSVTDHPATQKISERYGRLNVGLRIASSPAIFVDGGVLGERTTTALNYRQLTSRNKRDIYVPEKYRELVQNAYKLLNIEVNLADKAETEKVLASKQQLQANEDNYFDCYRDLTWNRATISACGNEIISHKIQAMTDILKESKVDCIVLSLDIESAYTPHLAEEAAKLGYFYSGIFPSYFKDGHDTLQMQFLNQIKADPAKIVIYQPSGQKIMDFIKKEAPHVFITPNEP